MHKSGLTIFMINSSRQRGISRPCAILGNDEQKTDLVLAIEDSRCLGKNHSRRFPRIFEQGKLKPNTFKRLVKQS